MRLGATSRSTLLLGLLVALAAWTPQFVSPTIGLDPSWQSGLFMAAKDGLSHGTEIVFTYGPLGYLGLPYAALWFGDLAGLAFVFQSLLFVAVCLLVVRALRTSSGMVLAVVVAYAALVITEGTEQAILLAVAGSLLVLEPERPRFALEGLLVGGAVLAALECLIKISVGPIVFAICLLGLIGARARPREIAAYVGLFVVALVALWLISGQSISDLDDYLGNSREIVSGYSEALPLVESPGWWAATAAASVVALTAAAALTSRGGNRERLFAAALVLVAAFAVFKEGVVRLEPGHMSIFFSTALLLWLVLPWRGRARAGLALGAVALAVMTLVVRPPEAGLSANPIDNVRNAGGNVKTLLSSSRRYGLIEGARVALQNTYDLEGRARAAVGQRSVAIEPWESAIAWAYDLNWSPLPVFHSYTAYTPRLDRLNADAVASAEGPEVILRHDLGDANTFPTLAIDGRYPGWEAPAQALATICHFAAVLTTERWEVLRRIPDRCGEPEAIGTAEAADGEAVEVPEAPPGSVTFMRIGGLEVGGIEKLRSLLLRANIRYALLDGEQSYRVVPGTAVDGLLLDGPRSVIGSGAFAQAPEASSISIQGSGGELRYEFFAMPVGSAPGARPG